MFGFEDTELIYIHTIVVIVALSEWWTHQFSLLLSSRLIVSFLFKIVLIPIKPHSISLSFDLFFGLTRVIRHKFNILGILFQRHTVTSPIQNSLSCLLLLSVFKDFGRWQWPSSLIVKI